MGAKTIKTTPEKLCKMIDSFEDDARCGNEIKTKRRRCLRRKRWTKHGSCKFGKIFKQVTKRRRRKRRSGTFIDGIEFTNITIRHRRTTDGNNGVDCSKSKGGRKKRFIAIACFISVGAVVSVFLINKKLILLIFQLAGWSPCKSCCCRSGSSWSWSCSSWSRSCSNSWSSFGRPSNCEKTSSCCCATAAKSHLCTW